MCFIFSLDNSHRQISRVTSRSVPLPPSPNVGQLRRSQTCEYSIPDITVSLSEVQSYPQLAPKQEATENLLSPPESLQNVSLDGCYIPPQQMEPESTRDGLYMSNGKQPSCPLPNVDSIESERECDENRPRASTGPSKSSRSDENSISARHGSWSVGMHGRNTNCTYNITYNFATPTSSPAISRSESEEAMAVERDNVKTQRPLAESSRTQTYPNKKCTSLKPGTRQHPGLSESRSAPSKLCEEKQGRSVTSASDEGDNESNGARMRPRSRVMSRGDKPKAIGAGKPFSSRMYIIICDVIHKHMNF